MANANIEVGVDFQKAINGIKLGKEQIENALKIKPLVLDVPNLNPAIQQRIVLPSGNARMAVASVSQAMNDAQMFQQSFRMGMMSIGNNIDMLVNSLVQLSAETKRTGASFFGTLKSTILGPSGILLGVSMLVTALTVLPTLFDSTGKAADTAAEGGLKKYAERLSDLGAGEVVAIGKRIEAQKTAIQEQINGLGRIEMVSTARGELAKRVYTKQEEALKETLEERMGVLGDFLDKNKDAIDEANQFHLIMGLAGGVLGTRPFDKQKRDAAIAAMKEGIDKEKALADQKLKDDEERARKEISNQKARDEIIANHRKEHARKIAEIEKPLKDVQVLMSGVSLSEQFKQLGMSGADLDRVMKYDRSGAENQLAELEKMKRLVAGSDLGDEKKFSVTKDIENEIEQVKRKRIEAENDIQQLRISLINDEEAREIESIRVKYKERIDTAALEHKSAEETYLLIQSRDAEIERKKAEFAKRRANEEDKLERELSQLRMYNGENELQQRLHHIHQEYERRKESVEELARLKKIDAEEERQLLQGLTDAEHRDRVRATNRYHEQLRNEWKETHQAGMGAINSLNSGISEMMRQFVGGQRQAKDEWDAVWLAMKNSAVNSLTDIITKYVENEIIARALGITSTAATVAEMTAIAVAATPAALAVNIATMGAAGAAAAASFGVASGTLAASMSAMKIVAAADGARITKPTLTMIGEAGETELIAPEKDFYSVARDLLVPNVLSLIARDGINVDGYRSISGGQSGGGITPASMRRLERGMRDVEKAINGMELSVDITDDRLLWVVKQAEVKKKKLMFGKKNG